MVKPFSDKMLNAHIQRLLSRNQPAASKNGSALKALALVDSLSERPGSRLFQAQLDFAIYQAERETTNLCLLAIHPQAGSLRIGK